MKFLLAIFVIRFVLMLFSKNNGMNTSAYKNINAEQNTASGDDIHPAGFEVRDHFMVRCSDEFI